MGLICMIRGHDWKCDDWEKNECLRPPEKPERKEHPDKQHNKELVAKTYRYIGEYNRKCVCNLCGKENRETEHLPPLNKTVDLVPGKVIDAEIVHDSEEMRDLVEFPSESRFAFPTDDSRDNDDDEISKSRKAHKQAKQRASPVEIGDYITAGIEDISKHHSGSSNPIVRHEGFVIIVKKSPENSSIGDVITVKITSFNKGDSANAVFVSREDE